MTLAAVLLLLAPAPVLAQCEASRQKQADLKKESDARRARHLKECTLCADGSACREGFEHRDGGKRMFEAWRVAHGLACAACGASGCGVADAAWAQAQADVKSRHRELCRACSYDPARCEAWKRALDEARLRHEAWKREHPAACDRCSPDCEDWRRRAAELAKRSDETLQRHRERCADCKAGKGGCERPAAVRQDAAKDRASLWKAHLEACACSRGARR